MPARNGRLYLFEALALREEYDRRIVLLEKLLDPDNDRRSGLRFVTSGEDALEPAPGFDPQAVESELKKLKTLRVKLNQAIQMVNFDARVDFEGERISIAEALETRKSLLTERNELMKRVTESAYRRVIHKEERDVVKSPLRPFDRTYGGFLDAVRRLRALANTIHAANHSATVAFREE